MTSPSVIAIFGPTGVGKTAVTLALARRLRERGEDPVAVSADALQVYAGIETLTSAPTAAERQELEHRLVSFLGLSASFSAGEYARLAHAQIDELLDSGRRPLVVGGTGLYLRAALAHLDLRPPAPPGSRERWTAELEAHGAPALHAELIRRAPGSAARIDRHDRQRLVRALELLDAGQPAASAESQLWTAETRHPTLLAGLVMDRQVLYERIDARVEAMVAAGAIEEVRRAHAAGASATARQALGFAELLAGDVDAMKRRTRNYAKRQLTWMRKLAGIRVLDVTGRSAAEVADEVTDLALVSARIDGGPEAARSQW